MTDKIKLQSELNIKLIEEVVLLYNDILEYGPENFIGGSKVIQINESTSFQFYYIEQSTSSSLILQAKIANETIWFPLGIITKKQELSFLQKLFQKPDRERIVLPDITQLKGAIVSLMTDEKETLYDSICKAREELAE